MLIHIRTAPNEHSNFDLRQTPLARKWRQRRDVKKDSRCNPSNQQLHLSKTRPATCQYEHLGNYHTPPIRICPNDKRDTFNHLRNRTRTHRLLRQRRPSYWPTQILRRNLWPLLRLQRSPRPRRSHRASPNKQRQCQPRHPFSQKHQRFEYRLSSWRSP